MVIPGTVGLMLIGADLYMAGRYMDAVRGSRQKHTQGTILLVLLGLTAIVSTYSVTPAMFSSNLMRPTNPTEYWTMVAGLGAVATAVFTLALVLVARWGLAQIRVAKLDIETRSQRESIHIAVLRCEEWAKQFIPENAMLMTQFAASKIPVFIKEVAEVRFDPDNPDDLDRAKQWWTSIPPQVTGQVIGLLNRIESWAMYFTSGLGDSKLAAGPCAPTYCQLVVQYYPILRVIRSQGNNAGKFPNAVKLYKSWLAGLETEQRERIRGNLMKQLQQLDSKGNTASELLPDPVGTRVDR